MSNDRRIIRLAPGVEIDPVDREARWIGSGAAPAPLMHDQWYSVFAGPFYIGPEQEGQLRRGDFLWLLCTDETGRQVGVQVDHHEAESRPAIR